MTFHTTVMRTAGLSAVLAAVVSIIVAGLGVAITGSVSGVAGTVRSGARGWLVGIGAGIRTGNMDVTLIPLGAVLIAIALVVVSVRAVVSGPVTEPVTFIVTLCGAYGILAAIGAIASDTPGTHISFVRAAIAGFIVSGIGAAIAVAPRQSLAAGVPPRVRRICAGAGVACAIVVSCAVLAATVLFAVHLPRAGDMWAALDPGVFGGIGVGLACLLLAPNLAAWAVSVLVGPGFAMGTDSSVDVTGADLGSVPGLPILAAIPSDGPFPGWAFLLAMIPLLAGVVAGMTARNTGLTGVVCDGVLSGALAGFLIGVLTAASSGAVTDGRMSDIGPGLVQPGLAAIVALAAGGAIGAVLRYYYKEHYPGSRGDAADRGPRVWLRKHLAGITGRGRRLRISGMYRSRRRGPIRH